MSGPAGDGRVGAAAPAVEDPVRLVVWQLLDQARSCATMGSPLYAEVLVAAALDVLEGGAAAALLVPLARPGRGDAAALRLLAAVHRLVLRRRAPSLALHYPSVGGTPGPGAAAAFLATLAAHHDHLADDVAQPCQTNEVGRCCGLLVGYLDVAARTGLPLALHELGASGGLNLRVDRYRYEVPVDGGAVALGPADAEVVFRDRYRGEVPHAADGMPLVVARRGCDLRPVDPTTEDGRVALSASVWADQVDRFARLGGALRTAAAVPATVDRAPADAWVAEQLATPADGACTVVAHSVVREYVPAAAWSRVLASVEQAGERATDGAPLAHVQLEPADALRHHAVTVRVWPHAPDPRVLATCGAHGTDVVPGGPA